jgi:hypothetical protein
LNGGGGIRNPKALPTTPIQDHNANTTEHTQSTTTSHSSDNADKQFNADSLQEHNTILRQKCAICVLEKSGLKEIADVWPDLPDHIKETIKTLVGSVTIVDNDNVSK